MATEVELVKHGNFKLDESKYEKINKDTLDMLVDPELADEKVLPKMMYFKDKREYKYNSKKFALDPTKPVFIGSDGSIFVYMSGNVTPKANEDKDNTEKAS